MKNEKSSKVKVSLSSYTNQSVEPVLFVDFSGFSISTNQRKSHDRHEALRKMWHTKEKQKYPNLVLCPIGPQDLLRSPFWRSITSRCRRTSKSRSWWHVMDRNDLQIQSHSKLSFFSLFLSFPSLLLSRQKHPLTYSMTWVARNPNELNHTFDICFPNVTQRE